MTPEQALETLRPLLTKLAADQAIDLNCDRGYGSAEDGLDAVSVLAHELERLQSVRKPFSTTLEIMRERDAAVAETLAMEQRVVAANEAADAAVAERDKLRGYLDITRGERDEWARRNEAAVAERDAAIERLPETARTLGWMPPDEAERLREALERLEKERDDAERMVAAVVSIAAPAGRFFKVTRAALHEDFDLTRIDQSDGAILLTARAALRGHDPTLWEGNPDPSSHGGHPYTPTERALGYGTPNDPRFAGQQQPEEHKFPVVNDDQLQAMGLPTQAEAEAQLAGQQQPEEPTT